LGNPVDFFTTRFSIRNDLIHELNFPVNLGNREVFIFVYKVYYHPLKYFISRIAREDEAEDLVEDVFVNIWKAKPEFQNKSHLQAFLYRAATNLRIDYLKSHRVNKTEPLANQDLQEVQNYQHDMVRAELLAEIYRAIHKLPSQCQKVIRMSFIDGLSNKEIADQLGINEQSVKNHKSRGLSILKGNLSDPSLMIILMSSF
jgi:RNA polymerase sigma-70 factor (family 1)